MVCVTERLRQILAAGDRPIDGVAKAAGLPQPVLYKFLKGDTPLDGESLDRLAKCLRVKLQQEIYWDEYLANLTASGQLEEAWEGYELKAWTEYEKDAWPAHVSVAWAESEPDLWGEFELDAWPKALASGESTTDEYDCWKTTIYQDWYEDEYPSWLEAEYEAWKHDYGYCGWYGEARDEWEVAYLASVRKELEDREYVVVLDSAT